jgi:hypothetical protein
MKRAHAFLVTTAVAISAGGAAHAQPAVTPLTTPASPEPVDAKSPSVAVGLSLVGSLGSAALVLGGASLGNGAGQGLVLAGLAGSLVAPSLGHWYAGHYLTAGLGARLVGGAVFTAGLATVLSDCLFETSCDSSGGTLVVLGAVSYVGGMIYDIATASGAAQDYNEAHHLRLAPTVVPSGAGQGLGLGLSGVF